MSRFLFLKKKEAYILNFKLQLNLIMSVKTILMLLVCLPALCFGNSPQKNYPIPIYVDGKVEMPFINNYGEVVFKLPAGDRPVYLPKQPGSMVLFMVGFEQPMNVFFDDICVVRAKGGSIYWIDPAGKKIHDFGKEFYHIDPFRECYTRAFRKIEGTYSSEILYLDRNGQKAFGGKAYWEAEPFSEGLAGVQLEENGDWGYIDPSGKMVVEVKGKSSRDIIRLHSFSEGKAQVTVKVPGEEYQRNAVYINRKGEILFDVRELFPDRKLKKAGEFREGLVDIALERTMSVYDLAYVDESGSVKLKMGRVGGHSGFIGGKAYYKKMTPAEGGGHYFEILFFNQKGASHKIEDPEGIRLSDVKIYSDCCIQFSATTREGFKERAVLFDNNTEELLLVTGYKLVGFNDRHILVLDGKNQTHKLKTLDGKFLWGTAPEDHLYTDLPTALKNPQLVKHYLMTEGSDFENGFWKLTNLESLQIRKATVTEIPSAIAKLKKLKSIRLNHLPELQKISVELGKLPALESLDITDCPRLTEGVEGAIEASVSLRSVYMENVDLQPGFEEKMQQKRPDLRINAMTSLPVEIMEVSDFE